MDQKQIGTFIAERRQQMGLTQKELAERLAVSNRAVSKWETGNGLPDIGNMQRLCEALDIRINDLLSGEVLTSDSYSTKAEENMLHLIKEQHKERRARWLLRGLVGVMLVLLCILWSFSILPGTNDFFIRVANMIDLPSFIVTVFGTFLMLAVTGLLRDFLRGLRFGLSKKAQEESGDVSEMYLAVVYAGKYVVCIGCISALLSFIEMMHHMDEPSLLGPSCAVITLSILYAVMLRLLFLPIEIALRKRL